MVFAHFLHSIKLMDKNVYITGFMGVGKSTVARDLAKYLVWDFVDLDHEVETLSHRSVNDVTERQGLSMVREWEKRALGKTAERKSQVVALGAGTLLSADNQKLVKESGLLIYLSSEISTLIKRLTEDTSKERPLFGKYVTEVQNKIPNAEKTLRSEILTFFRERLPTYVKADMKIDTDDKSPRAITIEIEKRLRFLEQKVESSEDPKQLR
jgi:shikimate kinase